jgi:predicted RNase H-like HicB family nuclease
VIYNRFAVGREPDTITRTEYEGGTMRIKVILHPDEDGGFWVEVPGMPGVVSEGETADEALANIRDAIETVLSVDEGDPEDRTPGDVPCEVELF